jgi:Spy/CpxP family protein refolding chaperone
MKPNRLLIALAVGSLVAFSATVQAADKNKAETSATQPAGKGAKADQLKIIADKLQLTDAQKEQIKPILQDEAQKLKAIRKEVLTKTEKTAKIREIKQATSDKIKPILTDKQREQWTEMQKTKKGQTKGTKRNRKA